MKRLFLFVALVFVSLFILARQTPVNADYVNPVPEEYKQAVREARTGVVNAEGYRTGGFTTQLWALSDAIVKFSCEEDRECLQSGALPTLARYGGLMYTNPPASSIAFVRDVGQTLGFIPKTVYAQGIGFSRPGLLPLLDIWKAFRNIAYLLLSVILVVIGFMVMFRKKIDPKTVVTVQNALPRVVVALLLVTFSYAIVGFMIDLMYLVMFFTVNLLIRSEVSQAINEQTRNQVMTGSVWDAVQFLIGSGSQAVDDLVKLFFGTSVSGSNPFWNTVNIIPWIIESVVVWLIVALALLFAFVRILFMLINAYIQIIVALLVAPLQLMMEAIPGTSSFSSWFKNLVANLSVFPITAAMFLVGIILTQTDINQELWTPPFLRDVGSGGAGVAGLIGLGILFGIPTAAGSIKEALKAKAPVAAGPGTIVGAFGPPTALAMQLYQLLVSHKSMQAFRNIAAQGRPRP